MGPGEFRASGFTWTPKVVEIMAQKPSKLPKRQLFYILWGVQVGFNYWVLWGSGSAVSFWGPGFRLSAVKLQGLGVHVCFIASCWGDIGLCLGFLELLPSLCFVGRLGRVP